MADKSLKDIVKENANNGNFGMNIEEYTYYDCPEWRICELAFDLYNTDGDCLVEK